MATESEATTSRSPAELEARVRELDLAAADQRKKAKRLARKDSQSRALERYQVELLKLQRHLEIHSKRMIVLVPDPQIVASGAREIELMDANRLQHGRPQR